MDESLSVFKILDMFRRDMKYCDVIVTVKDVNFPAHRNILAAWSPKFDCLLNGSFPRKSNELYRLTAHNVIDAESEVHVFSDFMDFLYSGNISLNDGNYVQLLRLATSLNITKLCEKISNFIHLKITQNLDHLFFALSLAKKYDLQCLFQQLVTVINDQATDIAKEDIFLSLSINDVLEITSMLDKHANIYTLNSILQLIFGWVKYDPTNRDGLLRYFLSTVSWSRLWSESPLDIEQLQKELDLADHYFFILLKTLVCNDISLGPYAESFQDLQTQFLDIFYSCAENLDIVNNSNGDPVLVHFKTGFVKYQKDQLIFDKNSKTVTMVIENNMENSHSSDEGQSPSKVAMVSEVEVEYGQSSDDDNSEDFVEDKMICNENKTDVTATVVAKGNNHSSSQGQSANEIPMVSIINKNLLPTTSRLLNAQMKTNRSNQNQQSQILPGEGTGRSGITDIKLTDVSVVLEKDTQSSDINLTNQQKRRLRKPLKTQKKCDSSDVTKGEQTNKKSVLTSTKTDSVKPIRKCSNKGANDGPGKQKRQQNGGDDTNCNACTTNSTRVHMTRGMSKLVGGKNLTGDIGQPDDSCVKENVENRLDKVKTEPLECSDIVVSEKPETKKKSPAKAKKRAGQKMFESPEKKKIKSEPLPNTEKKKIKSEPLPNTENDGTCTVSSTQERSDDTAKSNIEILHCDFCKFQSKNNSKFLAHVRSHYKGPPYKCKECDYKNVKFCRVYEHKFKHSNKKNFACKECGQSFKYPSTLKHHNRWRHIKNNPYHVPVPKLPNSKMEPDIYHCDFCDFKAKISHIFLAHLKTHYTGPPYKCHDCDYKHTRFSRVYVHRFKHSDVKSFVCNECGLSFKYPSTLKNHRLRHFNDELSGPPENSDMVSDTQEGSDDTKAESEIYQCDFCEFQVNSNPRFMAHLRTHYKGPPYMCKQCDYKNIRFSRVYIHTFKHSEEKRFTCKECGQCFKFPSGLMFHKKLHGKSREKKFSCPHCDKMFFTKPLMEAHIARHRDDRPFLCDLCGFSSRNQSALSTHRRIHSGRVYKCEYPGCSYVTPRGDSFKRHTDSHKGLRPHQCHICGKAFRNKTTLSMHEQIHTGFKPYKCSVCDYASYRKDKCQEHMKKRHQGLVFNMLKTNQIAPVLSLPQEINTAAVDSIHNVSSEVMSSEIVSSEEVMSGEVVSSEEVISAEVVSSEVVSGEEVVSSIECYPSSVIQVIVLENM